MHKMTIFLLWLLNKALVLYVIIQPTWTFSVVHSMEGDIILLSSQSYGNISAQQRDKHGIDMCSITCITFFSEQRHVYLKSVYDFTSDSRQSLFAALQSVDTKWNTVIQGIRSLLSKDKWRTQILLTSPYKVDTAVSASIQSLTSKLLLFTMDKASRLNDTLHSLYVKLEKKELNFIVVCSVTCIVEVFNQVYQFETTFGKTSNKWLLITTSGFLGEIFNSSVPDAADMVVIDPAPYQPEYPALSWSDLRKVLSNLKPTNPRKTYEALADYIEKRKPVSNSAVSADVYILNTHLKEKTIQHIGHISGSSDVTVSEDLFPGFKYGFRNRTLTVSTLEWPPFVFKSEERGTIIYSGVCIDILHELSRSLNFSYRIIEPEDHEWGRKVDGRWTGFVGQMAYKKADLIVGPISNVDPREHVMDFTIPYFYVRTAIIMKKPDPNTNKWMTLVAPFRFEIHMCIVLSLIISTVFLFIVEEIHPVNTWTNNRLSARRTRYGNILWYYFGAMIANGGSYVPTTQSGRTVLSCWWLFTVISAAIYSGNLIAFLTDWREKPPFTTLAEMVEQDTYKWGTVGTGSFTELFKNSNLSLHKKVWRGMDSDSEQTSGDVSVHTKKVLEEQYAYLGDETMIPMWKSSQCQMKVYYDPFYSLNYAIGLPNNSLYTGIFSEQILRINEMGLPRQWYRQWYKRWSSNVQCETLRSAKRVDLLALQSAFYAAGIGVLLGISVLIAEVIYRNKRGKFVLSTANHEEERTYKL